MKIRTHFLQAAALVLVIGLGYNVTAQKTAAFLPPEPINPVVNVNAIEISDGTIGYDENKGTTAFGYSFLGRTTGEFPGSFTLSMNCTPAVGVAGGASLMTGGSWTLPVYIDGARLGSAYAGSLYGTIANGKMAWDKTGKSAEVYFILNVDGGTQNWEGTNGYASFAGNLFLDEKAERMVLQGSLIFNTLAAVSE
jgi:hypothetical protein